VSSKDSRLWCWYATTHLACDDAQSQRWGWRRVLSIFIEVGVHHGRVTLAQKSCRSVCASNTSFTLRSVHPEYSMSSIESNLWLKLLPVGVKTTGGCLSTDGKPFYVTRPLPGLASPGFLYETFPPLPASQDSSFPCAVPIYSHPPRSLSTSQNTVALSALYFSLEPFPCHKWSHFWRAFLPHTLCLPQSLRVSCWLFAIRLVRGSTGVQ